MFKMPEPPPPMPEIKAEAIMSGHITTDKDADVTPTASAATSDDDDADEPVVEGSGDAAATVGCADFGRTQSILADADMANKIQALHKFRSPG